MRRILPLLLTIVIISLILLTINLQELVYYLSKTDIVILIASILLLFPIASLKAERWRVLFDKDMNFSKKDATKFTFAAFPFLALTPSNTGDLVKAYYLKKNIKYP